MFLSIESQKIKAEWDLQRSLGSSLLSKVGSIKFVPKRYLSNLVFRLPVLGILHAFFTQN